MTVSTSLPRRAAERGRARRRSRLLATMTVLLVTGLLATTGWVVLVSGALGVEHVTVTGVHRLRVADVEDRADIAIGTPLARLDTEAVVRRLSVLAAVRSVEVGRRWPHTVEITVREREPAAARAMGSSWVLVDRTGVVFAAVDRRPKALPLVGAPPDAGRRELRAAMDVLDVLPAPVRQEVREVRVGASEQPTPQLTLRLSRGRTVVWGSPERGERKAAVLAVLLTRKASAYDVSAPDTPTTRK